MDTGGGCQHGTCTAHHTGVGMFLRGAKRRAARPAFRATSGQFKPVCRYPAPWGSRCFACTSRLQYVDSVEQGGAVDRLLRNSLRSIVLPAPAESVPLPFLQRSPIHAGWFSPRCRCCWLNAPRAMNDSGPSTSRDALWWKKPVSPFRRRFAVDCSSSFSTAAKWPQRATSSMPSTCSRSA